MVARFTHWPMKTKFTSKILYKTNSDTKAAEIWPITGRYVDVVLCWFPFAVNSPVAIAGMWPIYR
ncbi:hypothetical protein EAY50_26225 [Vibrio anguillarum]|nr:hypothetical protein [Vibrio anguillarum]